MSAPRATIAAVAQFVDVFTQIGGLMAERVTDLQDIRDRVIAELIGLPEPGVPQPTQPSILCAEDLAPADTAGLDPEMIIGLATTLGGPTSHTAIIARQLGIPCVVAVAGLSDVPAGASVLVDGTTGTVTVSPDEPGGPGGGRRGAPRGGALGGMERTRRHRGRRMPSRCWPTCRTARPRAPPVGPRRRASGCSAPSCASSTATPSRPSRNRPASTGRCWRRSPVTRSSCARWTPGRTSR